MPNVTVVRAIRAPAGIVYDAIADPRRFAQAIRGVTRVEDLSDVRSGVGVRYRQTRSMKGREMTMDFEVTEFVRNERIRIVNETHGAVWDSLFTLERIDGSTTKLTMSMDARGQTLLPKLLLPLVCRFIRKAVEQDVDDVRSYCEKGRQP